jgi:hypothetical protein
VRKEYHHLIHLIFDNRELEDGQNLDSFSPDQVYSSVILCLRGIDEKKAETFPSTMPRGMSSKVNATTELANLIKVILVSNKTNLFD